MPSLSTPWIVRVPTSPGTPGRRAPGRASAPSWPGATFGAPHTTWTEAPGCVTTALLRSFVPGIGSTASTRATITPSGAGGSRWTVSTARPRPESRSVSLPTSGSSSSKNSCSQETGTLTARPPCSRRAGRARAPDRRRSQAPPELAQDAHVALVEVPDVGHAVWHHRQALDAEAEREAGHALVADGLEHPRVHHPAAAELEPLLLPRAWVGPPDRELGAGLYEGEVRRQEPRARARADEGARHLVDRAAQVGHRDALADDERLELVELRLVGRVDGLVAEHLARHDDLEGRLVRLHVPDLHGARVGAQEPAVGSPERVLRVAGGVLGREVERLEVVAVRLELGAGHDLVAQGGEDVEEPVRDERQQVQPARRRTGAGERDVEALARELPGDGLALQLLAATLEGGLEGLLLGVDGLAGDAALLGGQRPEALQAGGDDALLAQEPDAVRLQGLQVRRGGDAGELPLQVQTFGSSVFHVSPLHSLQREHHRPTRAVVSGGARLACRRLGDKRERSHAASHARESMSASPTCQTGRHAQSVRVAWRPARRRAAGPTRCRAAPGPAGRRGRRAMPRRSRRCRRRERRPRCRRPRRPPPPASRTAPRGERRPRTPGAGRA